MARYYITLDNGDQYYTCDTDSTFSGNTYTGNGNLYLLTPGYTRDDYRPYIFGGTDAVNLGSSYSSSSEYAHITDVDLVSGGLGVPLLVGVACIAVLLTAVKVVFFK